MDGFSEVRRAFGNKLRVRVCGICIENGKLLLIKHKNLGKGGYLWAPPGGGVDFGESVEECLLREFKEETGLIIKVSEFLFVSEFLLYPLHAIELFFKVEQIGGELMIGSDPELSDENQLIEEVRFLDDEYLKKESKECIHKAITLSESIKKFSELRGYFYLHP